MSGSTSTVVSVLTPSLSERSGLLDECRASVAAQTVPVEHLVYIDNDRVGPQLVRNALARQATTEWLLPVDDDATLDPDCVEVLLDRAGDADVVYPFCRMDGRDDWCPNRLFAAKTLLRKPFIPVTSLVRKDLWETVGGHRPEPLEDWRF